MSRVVYSSEEEFDRALFYLGRHFDIARLVNPITTTVEHCDHSNGEGCYEVWDYNKRCRNCTSTRVLITGEQAHKFEKIGDNVFLVTSERVDLPTGPAVLELVSRMEHRFEEHYHEWQDDLTNIEELKMMAFQDSLTGVFNRRYAEERLAKLTVDTKARGGDLLIALIDIDRLKQTNDTWGHFAGDALIKQVVASVLAEVELENEDAGFFARTGGDEFMLVKNMDNPALEQPFLQRIVDRVALGSLKEYPQVAVSASIGAVMLSECPGISLVDAATIADKRLYAAKKSGRRGYVAADEPSFPPPPPEPDEQRLYRRDEPYPPKPADE